MSSLPSDGDPDQDHCGEGPLCSAIVEVALDFRLRECSFCVEVCTPGWVVDGGLLGQGGRRVRGDGQTSFSHPSRSRVLRAAPREAGGEMVDAELIDSSRTGGESEIGPDHATSHDFLHLISRSSSSFVPRLPRAPQYPVLDPFLLPLHGTLLSLVAPCWQPFRRSMLSVRLYFTVTGLFEPFPRNFLGLHSERSPTHACRHRSIYFPALEINTLLRAELSPLLRYGTLNERPHTFRDSFLERPPPPPIPVGIGVSLLSVRFLVGVIPTSTLGHFARVSVSASERWTRPNLSLRRPLPSNFGNFISVTSETDKQKYGCT